jgi:hypothetical protein
VIVTVFRIALTIKFTIAFHRWGQEEKDGGKQNGKEQWEADWERTMGSRTGKSGEKRNGEERVGDAP